MSAPLRPRWSREEIEAARRRIHSALDETPTPATREAFAAEEATRSATPAVAFGPAFRAAAVLSRFRLDELREVAADADELRRLQTQSIALREEGWRTLAPDVRNAILRELTLITVMRLLNQHKHDDDPLQTAIRKAGNGLDPPTLRTLSVGELAALVQIHDGLHLVRFVPRNVLERRLQLARLLEPLRRITRTFSGRAAEMQQLRDYVGVLSTGSWVGDGLRAVGDFLFKPVPKAPFLIHGPGGVGKTTLTAKFILDHAMAAEKQQFPFAYLDFDRPTVNAEQPPTILIEAIRQIGLQYDTAFAASERLQRRWQTRLASGADTESYVRDFTGFLETLEVREGPVVFVFDTFEEVQRRSTAYARGVMLLTSRLSLMIPRLRVVIAGRTPLEDETYIAAHLALEAFDKESAVAYLQNSGVDTDTAKLIAARTGGNPLTLTLAIELYRRDPAELRQLDAAQLTDEIIQSSLFDRILLHIPDPEVRRLAHPGLVLRRVTPEIIREVLAKPCGIDVPDDTRAEELFEKLAADSTLVTRVDPRTLVHRSDVRRLMLKPLREHQPAKVEEIHRAAIEFYRRHSDVISRAEVAYHSLALSEPAALAPDLEPLLVNALEELAPAAQVRLAEAYKLELPPETWKTADQESWERVTARRIEELLQTTDVLHAIEFLELRAERSAHTELMVLEARAQLKFNDVDGARAVARRGIAAYRDAGTSTLLFRMLLVAAEIERRANVFDAAYSYLADAEDIARRRDDALMLVQVLTARADVEWPDDREEDPQLLGEIAGAAERMPDEIWRREQLLILKVVAHVAMTHPAIVTRAARLEVLELSTTDLETIAKNENCSTEEVERRLAEAPSPSLLRRLEVTLAHRVLPAKDRLDRPYVPSKNLKLKTAQREQLRDLLVKHYGGDLAGFLETRYSRGLESLSLADDDVPRNAMDLVRASEREGWLNDLIIGLWRSRFLSPDVLAFIDAIGLGPQVRVADGKNAVPEKRLRALLNEYRASIGALEARTFATDANDRQFGCGFLTGAGRALTYFQYLTADPSGIGVTFDRVVSGNRVIDQGKRLLLGRQILAPMRVTLLTLKGRMAEDPIEAARAAPGAPNRGAVTLPKLPSLDPEQPIFWLWRSPEGTFITGVEKVRPHEYGRYTADAKAATPMLGAPCFDAALNVVGIFAGPSPSDPKASIIAPVSESSSS